MHLHIRHVLAHVVAGGTGRTDQQVVVIGRGDAHFRRAIAGRTVDLVDELARGIVHRHNRQEGTGGRLGH